MSLNHVLRRFAALAFSILCAVAAVAGDGGDRDGSFSDSAFLQKAAVASLAQAELGLIAVNRSANPQVQQFANMMVHDHKLAGQKLRTVAAAVGVAVPARLDGKFTPMLQKFASLQGPQFDAEYAMAAVSDLEQTIRQYELASQNARNFSVRAHAKATLPVLREHLNQARMLLQQMQAAASAGQGGVLVHRYPVKGLTCPTYY